MPWESISATYDAFAAWCTTNPDCLGIGDHYTFDRVHLKSMLETNPDIANCTNGVGLSTGNGEPLHRCLVKNPNLVWGMNYLPLS